MFGFCARIISTYEATRDTGAMRVIVICRQFSEQPCSLCALPEFCSPTEACKWIAFRFPYGFCHTAPEEYNGRSEVFCRTFAVEISSLCSLSEFCSPTEACKWIAFRFPYDFCHTAPGAQWPFRSVLSNLCSRNFFSASATHVRRRTCRCCVVRLPAILVLPLLKSAFS